MRKLNKKNKAYIIALSSLVAIVFVVIALFIIYKIKDINIKYEVSAGSFVYNKDNELVSITNDTYVKKDFLSNYYIIKDDKKINIGSNAIIYNSNARTIKLLGTFYEIKDSGEVNKFKGESDITNTITSRLFKISDRKYLVIGDNIVSSDNSLNAKDYLIINIDKQGNGYLYNNEINLKTFSNLVLNTDKFSLKVNSEKLIIGDEQIDLSKINGSTNEYVEKNESNETSNGNNDLDINNNGNNKITDIRKDNLQTSENNNQQSSTVENENIYPSKEDENVTEEDIKEFEVENKYITRKTTILSINTSVNKFIINYVVYDPFDEYESIYFNLYQGDTLIGKYNLNTKDTSYELNNLMSSTDYKLEFHYSYYDGDNSLQDVVFDSIIKSTDSVSGSISLEKVSNNSVSYILKIDDTIELENCVVNFYIDNVLIENAFDSVNIKEAISKGGYNGKITYSGTGSFGLLKVENCTYNGNALNINASYKYKI